MNIRSVTLEDAPFIAPVHIASWRAAYVGIVPQAHLDALDENQFAERWRTWITTEISASICVAEVDTTICGFASGGPIRKPVSVYDGELYAIYLAPNMQRKGIGRKLFVHITRELVARKLNHMRVWTLRRNPSAGFYERLGGSVVAEDVEEIGGESLPSIAYGWTNLATQSWS
jgi:GNAT superfamily N-acetyltransferase